MEESSPVHAQRKSKEWTQFHVSVKILKVLIAEIGSFQEAREDYEEQ